MVDNLKIEYDIDRQANVSTHPDPVLQVIETFKYHPSRQKYVILFQLSHKKRKDSLEGCLNRVLFAAELEFLKILALRLPRNSSNVNIKCSGKSKQLCSLCDQLLGALIYRQFIILILMFLIDYACYKLCNIWLFLF